MTSRTLDSGPLPHVPHWLGAAAEMWAEEEAPQRAACQALGKGTPPVEPRSPKGREEAGPAHPHLQTPHTHGGPQWATCCSSGCGQHLPQPWPPEAGRGRAGVPAPEGPLIAAEVRCRPPPSPTQSPPSPLHLPPPPGNHRHCSLPVHTPYTTTGTHDLRFPLARNGPLLSACSTETASQAARSLLAAAGTGAQGSGWRLAYRENCPWA